MDDDLILNIDLDTESSKPKSKARRRQPSTTSTSKPGKRPVDSAALEGNSTERPSKRRRTTPPRKFAAPSAPVPTSVQRTPSAEPEPPKSSATLPSSSKVTGQVVSSLFTSNPTIKLPSRPAPTGSSLPSNAPLKDNSTFDGLGLDPLISKHLRDRMHVEKPTGIQQATLSATLQDPDSQSRDLFIQSQTGSGKTLSYLLPIIQDLLPLSSLSYIDRSVGTLAIVIAPTRELAKQISEVLETLLQMRLSPRESERDSDDLGPRLTRWLVSGLLVGGGTRTHEKARLRKGIPILVATPGRLLDHLQNTESFKVAKCRWLVLDEADRLMELGFHETLQGIIKALDGRRNMALAAAKTGAVSGEVVGGWDWGLRRRNILCSATMKEDVQKLAGTALVNPLVIKATSKGMPQGKTADAVDPEGASKPETSTTFTPPSQLSQKYVVVPLKLRLVTLVALLRSIMGQTHSDTKKGGPSTVKVIVFLDCTDSVDYHWELLRRTSTEGEDAALDSSSESDSGEKHSSSTRIEARSALLPDASLFRLHGSLPLAARLAAVKSFSSSSHSQAVLLCTSVASRGLDLPLVRAVVQYDLPTEGGATEYIHRVGRTARAGKGGEAWAFVAPEEVAWVDWIESKLQGGGEEEGDTEGRPPAVSRLRAIDSEVVLKNGFGGRGKEVHERATQAQLALERWVLNDSSNTAMAQKAYHSHLRAYATHPSDEKHIFHVRNLHVGHVAKSFALRDAPRNIKAQVVVGGGSDSPQGKKATRGKAQGPKKEKPQPQKKLSVAERMQRVMKAQGRLTKKDGKLVSAGGADEFQVASDADALRQLMNMGARL